jgi:hypothetical protein
MLFTAALALIVTAAPAQDTTRGVIRGVVQSDPSGLPIPLAGVEAHDGEGVVVAVAALDGSYRLRVPAGRHTLRVRHMEHAPLELEVLVPPAGDVVMDVTLEHRPLRLDPIRVTSPLDPPADSTVVSPAVLGFVVDHHTLDDPGLGGALPGRFGGGSGGEGDGESLFVRGSAASLQLVLLDGAPVYAPFHMAGLVESFEPDVVGSARLYLGGAPARYDGGLSYVMDLSTRSGRGEHHRLAGSFDLVSGGLRAEGPLGAVRYLASARAVHGATLDRLEDEPFPYTFADGLLRVDAPLVGGVVSLMGFANQEGVRIDTVGAGDGFARWGNRAGSLRFRGPLEGAAMEITLAGGRFDADVPIRHLQRRFDVRGSSDRLRAGVDFTREGRALLFRYGAGVDRTWLTHRALGEDGRNLVYTRSAGTTAGGYLDATWQAARRVVLRGGLRGDAFSVGDVAVLAPRASATWLLTDDAALTLAAGRYHQYVRVPRPLGATPPANYADSVRLATHLAVGGASHFVLGLDQQLGGGLRLGLEGFYKRFDGLPPAVADAGETTDHTSGVDVWVRRGAGEVTGWLGYSLAWAWSSDIAPGVGSRFAGRQTLSAGVAGPVWRGTIVGARFAFGAGLSSTPVGGLAERVLRSDVPSYGNGSLETEPPLSGSSPGSYLRLDVHAARTWNARIRGRSSEVTPYLRVLNALDSRDGLFYRYFSGEDGQHGVQAVGTLPVVPVFGVSWRL